MLERSWTRIPAHADATSGDVLLNILWSAFQDVRNFIASLQVTTKQVGIQSLQSEEKSHWQGPHNAESNRKEIRDNIASEDYGGR